MGRAKRKHMPRAVSAQAAVSAQRALAARRVDRAAPLDDGAVEAILDLHYDYADDDPSSGIGYAVIAGAAIWTVIGALVLLV